MKMHPLLVHSTPKAPLDPGTAEFIKGKPAIVQAAKDWRYYETTITQMHEVEGALLLEYQEGGSWRAHYKTWEDACVPIGKSRRQIDRYIKEAREIRDGTECPKVDTANTLAKLKATAPPVELPDPLADLEAQIAKAAVHAGPAPAAPAPKAKASPPVAPSAPQPVPEAEHKSRVRNDNGKPLYAMPVWHEAEDGCGKLINRADVLNHLLPNREKHQRLRAALHSAFDEIQSWHELAKNHHA